MITEKNKAMDIVKKHREVIPGGAVSLNRRIDPMRVFVRAKGAYIWDIENRKYIDYHAAFSPHLLGHNDPDVNGAVIKTIQDETSLIGAGTTPWEGELARLVVECVPSLDQVQITNSGSEATFHALRIAHAATGKEEVIIMQGGYNGWHHDVSFNLMDPYEKMASYAPGEELPLNPITAGIPECIKALVHVVQFNDLDAVERILKKCQVACIITEPILQNIGLVKPKPGYLEGLRELCDIHGAILVFDEVKTGFRSALGGYQSICGVRPDLSTFGKAVANGYPLGIIGGKKEYMQFFDHPDPVKRVMIAGTYNAHPVPAAAAIATLTKLKSKKEDIYGHLERLGQKMEEGLNAVFMAAGMKATVVRQGSAFVVYFMDKPPENWLEISRDHDGDKDLRYRKLLVERGVFHFPLQTKQGSISFAHTEEDIDKTLDITEGVISQL